jgi:hypothetical protein
VPRVTLATAADGDDVWRAVCATFGNARRGDADHRDTGGQVYTEGWTAYTLTRGRLQSLLAAQSVALHEEGSGVAIVTSSVDHPSVRLGLLTGHESATEDLVAWTAAQAASMGFSTVRATLPASGAALPALRAAGFEENISFSMLLHEIDLD